MEIHLPQTCAQDTADRADAGPVTVSSAVVVHMEAAADVAVPLSLHHRRRAPTNF